MLRQIRLLARAQLLNFFGLNEARYSRDKKKKRRLILLAVAYAFIILMMMFYIGLMAYGLSAIGLTRVIPAFLVTVVSLITLMFTFYKAGNTLFNIRTYERVIVLPVRPASIVVARFFVMYVSNAAMAFLAILPGSAVYAWCTRPGPASYIMLTLGTFFVPLIPMAVASILGALVFGAASRMKHRNLANILLMLAFTLAMIVFPTLLSAWGERVTPAMLMRLGDLFAEMLGRVYPPAQWFAQGVATGNFSMFLLFVLTSAAVFALFVVLVQRKFTDVCRAMHARAARKNFKLRTQPQKRVLLALYRKELSRYFASPIYVLNTVIGYIMMVVGSIAIAILGVGKLDALLPGGWLQRFLPCILAMMAAITSTTSSAVSMEGKQWWIMQTAPVPARRIFDGKILVQLTIALPCYLVSCAILTCAFRLSALGILCLWVVPLIYILFIAVVGITINAKMPLFHWESDVLVVKQSASVGVAMLIGFGSVLIPIGLAFLLPGIDAYAVYLACALVLCAVTALLYRHNGRLLLSGIN